MISRSPAHVLLALLLLGAPVRAHNELVVDAGRGPVTIFLPDSYDPGTPLPLILLLHGLGSTGAAVESWLDLLGVVDEREFLYAHPDGSLDSSGGQFWNATDACCNLFGSTVDDSQYLSDLLEEIALSVSVDPLRVHLAGHSNGGFMSYRMACDHAERIASIASLAGATWKDALQCAPAQPVHVLQVHGTLDGTIKFAGGLFGGVPYPGAVESVEQWAGFGGCLTTGTSLPTPLDFVISLPGAETSVTLYDTGCEPGGAAELWTLQGAPHVPDFNSAFTAALVDWLLAHPRLPSPVSYCTAGVSVSGCSAALNAVGVPSASAASGFTVVAHQVEGQRSGLFFYGLTGAQAAPWGNGTSVQCVTPPVLRSGVLPGQGSAGQCDGFFDRDFNAYWAGAPAAKVPAAGALVWLQLWYRDPLNTSNQTTSLSDALELTVGP